LTNGEPEPKIDEARASEILAQEDLEVLVDLGVEGGEKANYWTCDFSHVSGWFERDGVMMVEADGVVRLRLDRNTLRSTVM